MWSQCLNPVDDLPELAPHGPVRQPHVEAVEGSSGVPDRLLDDAKRQELDKRRDRVLEDALMEY